MNVTSLNIRGLGSGEKKGWLRELVGKTRPVVVDIQETKIKSWNQMQVTSLWGG